jgi:hypothetical protein
MVISPPHAANGCFNATIRRTRTIDPKRFVVTVGFAASRMRDSLERKVGGITVKRRNTKSVLGHMIICCPAAYGVRCTLDLVTESSIQRLI